MARHNRNLSYHRKLALIIGNDSYSHRNNKLHHSVDNAIRLAHLLENINFKVTIYIDVRTDSKMKENVKKFANDIHDGDLVLFYYSGHGCHVNEKNYFIPVDDDRIDTKEEVLDMGTDFDSVFGRLLKKIPSYVTLFILDCCRPYVLKGASTSTERTEGNGLRSIERSNDGVLIQYACAANKTTRTNLFNEHLLKNITERNVDIVNVFQHIVDDVCQESKKEQRPLTINGLHRYEPIYLNTTIIMIPDILEDATWKSAGRTVAGGFGPGSMYDQLHCPQGLCVNRNGTILICDTSNHRIMKYIRGAKSGRRIAGKNIDGYGRDRLSGPSTVIYDIELKSFIFCDYHNRRVLRWSQGSKKCKEIIKENIACSGLAMDDYGFLYISDTEKHEVRRYRPGDRRGTVVAGGHGQGSRKCQLNHPTYIFVGRDRSVYVSDSWNNRVVKWDEGAKEGIVVAGGNGKGRDRSQLDCPTGVLIDQLGTVYVADHRNGRIMRWCNDATQGDLIVGNKYLSGDSAKYLNGPEGLAFDEDGNLYVADSYNNRVQRFAIKT